MERFSAKKIRTYFSVAGLVFLFLIFRPADAQAATLYFSPSSGSYTVGDILSTSVFVNTQEQAINNADAVLNFPPNLLEVVSVGKSGSVFSLWVEEPAFSNSAGTISFNGGLPTPGYNGTAGKVISIVFRIKETGSASVVCSSAAVRANDGYGTDVLQGCGQAQFTLVSPVTPAPEETVPEEEAVPPPTAPVSGVPATPVVTSSTHPDPNRWYNNNDPEFTWTLPGGTTGVNVLADRNPTSDPGTRSDGVFSSYGYDDVDDGIWYFHIRVRNANGWGPASHFRFNIDTVAPEDLIVSLEGEATTTHPRPSIRLKATDATSGIAYYEVRIESELQIIHVSPADLVDDIFLLPLLLPGEHTITVTVYDQAGNASTVFTTRVNILPINVPEITDYSKFVVQGETIYVKGLSYPNSIITLDLRSDTGFEDHQEVKTNEEGAFEATWSNRVRSGEYTLRAMVTDTFGAQSEWSSSVSISVSAPAVLRIGNFVITYFAVFLILLTLLVLLAFLLWREKHHYHGENQRLIKEIREVEETVHRDFEKLRKDMRHQLKVIEKAKTVRELTLEEEAIAQRLKKNMDLTEKMIGKEVKEVRKGAHKSKKK